MATDIWGIAARDAAWQRLSRSAEEPLDLLVIGGGVVGSGAALDAALRGIDVALVEERDIASGTSSRSSRLAHGGLRYLEQREFGLVHEALTERGLLLERIAPHLVRPLPFLLPLQSKWERSYFGAGVQLYDTLSRMGGYGGTMPRPRALKPEDAAELAPGLRVDEWPGGAVTFFDAQIDDARHTLACVRSAVAAGASVASRVKVIELIEEHDRVAGAIVRDTETGEELRVRAHCVMSAAGPWTNDILGMVGKESKTVVRRSRGVHLVVRGDAIPEGYALIARTPSSVLFLLPWGHVWLVGTTDDDWDGDLAEPSVTEQDVDYLLSQANRWLRTALTKDDVVGTYAGIRPLVADGSSETTQVSREHAIATPTPGLVVISGGKYTTYRAMAEGVIDTVVEQLAGVGRMITAKCHTDSTPLVGAYGWQLAWERRALTAEQLGVSLDTVEHLLRRHGDRINRIVQLITEDASLAERVHPDLPYLRAEIVIAVVDEGARSIEDVLVRRTHIALETRDPGPAVDFTMEILTRELGWKRKRRAAEIEAFEASPRARVPE
jgi:glycerol-3-phosphate dehydrogenase